MKFFSGKNVFLSANLGAILFPREGPDGPQAQHMIEPTALLRMA